MTKICLIAAFDNNKGVGIDNKLPWNSPVDLLRFKSLTDSYPIIMGRNTFESLPGILPNRTHTVLTKSVEWKDKINKTHPEIVVALNWNELYNWINEFSPRKIFFIGGPAIWKKGLELSHVLYITKIKGNYKVDTYFPDFNEKEWVNTHKEEMENVEFLNFKTPHSKIKTIEKKQFSSKTPKKNIYIEDLMTKLTSSKISEKNQWRFAKENSEKTVELYQLITNYVNDKINLVIKIKDKNFKEEKLKWFKERFEEYTLLLSE